MAVTVKELQLLIKNMCEIIIENEQYLQVLQQLKYKIHNMYVTNSYNM